MNVSKHVDLGLDSPLDCVQQLHASNPLHLLGDPVQESCVRRDMSKAVTLHRGGLVHLTSTAGRPQQPCLCLIETCDSPC